MIGRLLPSLLACALAAVAGTGAAGAAPRLARGACPLDCDASGVVGVEELVRAVLIGLGEAEVGSCAAADVDANGAVTVDEIVRGVRAALDGCAPVSTDPGAEPWVPVPREQVAAGCGLDPDLLDAADPAVARPYVVVRYGQLCHEYYPDGGDASEEVWSATKTLGGLVTGIAAYETRNLPRSGRKTGPILDTDRADHWLDDITFNPDAFLAHVLAMLAHNLDLTYGHREFQYDLVGAVQINRLSDVIATAIAQDPERLGSDVEVFTQRFLFGPLGMRHSTWTFGLPSKTLGLSWYSTVRDMVRVGLLILHGGLWNGARVLDAAWTYQMTHPAFEDANTGYGYLTWLNSASNQTFGLAPGAPKLQEPTDPCAPVAVYPQYPHGLSEAPDCNYEPPYTCDQQFDAGMWFAAGLGGQFIVGHPGLDLVLAVKNFPGGPADLWSAVRPALVALDPTFAGDEDAFCAEYARGVYAPDLN